MYHSGGDVDNGGGYVCVEAGGIWEISVSSSQFCWEAKTSLKKVLKNYTTHILWSLEINNKKIAKIE